MKKGIIIMKIKKMGGLRRKKRNDEKKKEQEKDEKRYRGSRHERKRDGIPIGIV